MTADHPPAPSAGPRGLPVGPRPIRRVEPPAAPWPATLARDIDGAMRLLVDVELLRGWDGWDAADDGHVLGPRSVVRRADGHDAVLRVCTEPVATFLERRDAAGVGLGAGEAVTLAVSLLRGVAEIEGRIARRPMRDELRGRWWLSDSAQPVFVSGEGAPAAEEAGRILAAVVAENASLSETLDRCIRALDEPRSLHREIAGLEAALFAARPAEPLATALYAPAQQRVVVDRSEDDQGAAGETRSVSWRAVVAQHIDGDLAELLSGAITAIWQRVRADRERPADSRGRRRRMALVAAAAGAAVLVGGLLWPTSRPDTATAEVPHTATSTSATASASPHADGAVTAAAGPTPGASPQPLDEVAAGLLADRRACHADGACLVRVQEDPAVVYPRGAVDRPGSHLTLTLLDDFGGAAVLRVASRDAGDADQLVVIVRVKDRWLLRDVHDVTEQPSVGAG